MSESNTDPRVAKTVDGVEVTKYFDEDEFHFPSMVIELDSERDEEVEIRIEEEKPDGISIENIGFHPAHGADHWSIDDQRLVFEYTLAPEGEYRTVYALRTKRPGEAREMFAEPTVIIVDPPLAESEPEEVEAGPEPDASLDIDVEADAEPASSFARSSAYSPYESDEDATNGTEESAPEPTDMDVPEEPAAAEDDTEEPAAAEGTTEQTDLLVERLARELREGDAPSETVEFLEERFGAGSADGGSIDARLTQVQEDISNLRSYTNAMEQFLDENGSAQDVIDDFEARMAQFESEVDEVESNTESLEVELRALRDEMGDVEDSLDALSSNVTELDGKIDSLRADLDETEAELPEYDIDEKFAEIESDVTEMSEFVSSLRSAFE